MKRLVIYIHGKGGNPKGAEHYKPLFDNNDIIGFDYKSQNPREAKKEFTALYNMYTKGYNSVILIAESIGAFFAMSALGNAKIDKAFLISPIVDMEKLIKDMMLQAKVSEWELSQKKEIPTDFGETLSWEYFCYIKQNPVKWNIPTYILHGEKDNLTTLKTITEFANKTGSSLTVMKNGEHWFHTDEQMAFLDDWIKTTLKRF